MLMTRQAPSSSAQRACLSGEDALVQAEGGLELRLQLGVVDDIVFGEGLLDEQEVEVIQRFEVGGVFQAVDGVAIHLQEQVRVRPAHGSHVVHIAAGLDLELDAGVALGEVAGDHLEQLLGGGLDADRDADFHPVAGAAEQALQREPLALGEQVPQRHLHAGFGHGVTGEVADGGAVGGDIAPWIGAKHDRDDEVFQDVPVGLGGLVGIGAVLGGGALAPGGEALGLRAG